MDQVCDGYSTRAPAPWGFMTEPISKAMLKSLAVQLHGQVYKYWICWVTNGVQRIRRYSVPPDPKTPCQLALRSRFAQAVSAGQALDDDARAYWEKIGVRKKEPLPWWNAFISAYMKDLVNPVTHRHINNLQVR